MATGMATEMVSVTVVARCRWYLDDQIVDWVAEHFISATYAEHSIAWRILMILANTFSDNSKTGVILLSILIVMAGRVHLVAQPDKAQVGESVPALSPPSKSVIYSDEKPKGASIPFFDHGYLIEFVHRTTSPEQPNIYLWNASGTLEHQLAVQPDHSANLYLNSVDVSANKQLVFAGSAENEGAGRIGFIAISDLDGTHPRVFRTGDYVPARVIQADDGSIWSVGAERASKGTNGHFYWNNYHALHHYSARGALLEQFLPRWDSGVAYVESSTGDALNGYDSQGKLIVNYTGPFWGTRPSYVNVSQSDRQVYLRSSGAITVLLDGLSNQVCTHSSVSKTFSCQKIAKNDSQAMMNLTGAALLADGSFLASMQSWWPASEARHALFILTPGHANAASEWRAVSTTSNDQDTSNSFGYLLGADDQSLVYRPSSQGHTPAVVYTSTW